MWHMIDSLRPVVDGLAGAFTYPSFNSASRLFLGWVMCLGRHTLTRTAQSAHPDVVPDHSRPHGLDTSFNFFARSAWTPGALAHHVGVLILTHLSFVGRITLLVDDTLAHKRGKCVWGMGWWRDAVASTQKRVATASGHNWVVLAIAYRLPGTDTPILALPLLARLHRPGKDQPGCAGLAKQMLAEVLGWFPDRTFTLVGDGAYACKELLSDLDGRVAFVGRLRGDAAVYDPHVPKAKKGRRGAKAKRGPRLPKPREAAAKADRKRTGVGAWVWRPVDVTVYGRRRSVWVVDYEAVWPWVLGSRAVRVWVVRDPEGRMKDCYLFTTDREADASWVVTQFAWRWSVEVLFRASKQVMDIEAPQHWCRGSVEKVAPWVWSMQSVLMVWYLTVGQKSPEALSLREVMGEWDSQWSLRHMLRVLRRATLDATIQPNSAAAPELVEMVNNLKNWANLAA
jgi:hypothetical protein